MPGALMLEGTAEVPASRLCSNHFRPWQEAKEGGCRTPGASPFGDCRWPTVGQHEILHQGKQQFRKGVGWKNMTHVKEAVPWDRRNPPVCPSGCVFWSHRSGSD